MPDLELPQDMPTDEDVHYWTHGDDEEDEATVRAIVYEREEADEDPQEVIKRRIHYEGTYVDEITDD